MAGQQIPIPSIFHLGDVPPGSVAAVGGKAAQLADLARAGFPVLPGLVITTSAQRATVDQLLAALAGLRTTAPPSPCGPAESPKTAPKRRSRGNTSLC